MVEFPAFTAVVGALSGSAGWLVTHFVGKTVARFFELRREASKQLLLFNLAMMERTWISSDNPTRAARIVDDLKAAEIGLKAVSAEMFALCASDRWMVKCLRRLKIDPFAASQALAYLSEAAHMEKSDRDAKADRVCVALRLSSGVTPAPPRR